LAAVDGLAAVDLDDLLGQALRGHEAPMKRDTLTLHPLLLLCEGTGGHQAHQRQREAPGGDAIENTSRCCCRFHGCPLKSDARIHVLIASPRVRGRHGSLKRKRVTAAAMRLWDDASGNESRERVPEVFDWDQTVVDSHGHLIRH